MKLTLLGLLATILTALGLHPTLEGWWWLGASVLCSVAAVAGCTLARVVGMPRPVVPLVGFLALILAVTQLSSRDTAILGVFPGPGAVHQYLHLMDKAFHYINVSVPPAPNKASLVALVAGGVGLIALLVDTCAVTYRAAALAGLPLLALYGVPVAVVRDGVPWIYFALGALGWMALILAEGNERVGSWGRSIRRTSEEPRTGRVVGRRIGAAALGLAIVIPAFLPGIGDGVVDTHQSDAGGGGGRVLTVNPFVSLAAALSQPPNAVVLDYKTDSNRPGYLSLVTEDRFDGTTWIPSSLTTSGHVGTHDLPPVGLDGAVTNQEIRTAIHLDGLQKSTWLPAPTPLVSVSTDPEWVYDDNHRIVWSPSGDTKGLAYTTTSLELTLTPAQLANAAPAPVDIQTRYTQLPTTGINPAVKKLAGDIITTANATTAIDKALALQNYFRSNFTYDATYRSPKQDPLGAFLETRKGFCQQFASAFAVMARQLNLPTRVVVGFLPGHRPERASVSDTWTVYWRDTHAWPEVYFSGLGWIRFEPTPRVDNSGLSLPGYALGSTSAPSVSTPSFLRNSGAPDTTNDTTENTSTGGSAWYSPGHLFGVIPWAWLGGLIVFLVLIALPGLFRRYLRRRRLDRLRAANPWTRRWPRGRSSRRPATTSAWSGPPHAPQADRGGTHPGGRPQHRSVARPARDRDRTGAVRPDAERDTGSGRRCRRGTFSRCSSVERPGSACGQTYSRAPCSATSAAQWPTSWTGWTTPCRRTRSASTATTGHRRQAGAQGLGRRLAAEVRWRARLL